MNLLQIIADTNSKDNHNCYTGDGIMINSDLLNGLFNTEAKSVVIQKLCDIHAGYSKTDYRQRNWSISRQKYWVCQISMIYCKNCGPVKHEDLPVQMMYGEILHVISVVEMHKEKLIPLIHFLSHLGTLQNIVHQNKEKGIDTDAINKWMPVNCSIGGAEHTVMHLLYARFFAMLQKMQLLECNATYQDVHGNWLKQVKYNTIMGSIISNKEVFLVGYEKMSKSKLNCIEPSENVYAIRFTTRQGFILE